MNAGPCDVIRVRYCAGTTRWRRHRRSNIPTKPVRIIVPFPAGGVTDIAARLIAQKLSERLGQQFYIENIAGAGGNLGMGKAAKAAGDGYTILFASSSIVVNPSLYDKVPYDIDKDFIPVTKAGGTPNSWVVNAELSGEDDEGADRAHQARARQAQRRFARRRHHAASLSIEMFKLALKLDFVVVPFAGGGPMTTSVLGGHTPIVCGGARQLRCNLIKEGKLRALAVTAQKRSAALPDVPTLEEFGIKDQEAETMTGVFVPAGTPKPIVDLLQREISAIVNAPDIKARLLELGVEAEGNSQAEFAAYVKAEVAKWSKVIEDAKIPRICSNGACRRHRRSRLLDRDVVPATLDTLTRSRPGARACPRALSRCRQAPRSRRPAACRWQSDPCRRSCAASRARR